MRSEFERHRYVNQIGTVDKLLYESHAEFQVRCKVWGGYVWAMPRD